METNEEAKHSRDHRPIHNSPPKKKSKSAHNMKDDARDSLLEFQSSIFDASDGHQLVDFIRKKKGLRSQPQKIFDDVRTDRQSLQIEIQRLDEDEDTLQPEPEEPVLPEVVDNEICSTTAQNAIPDSPKSPRNLPKSPTIICSKLKLKRLTHSLGRRTLLKEFERTVQESDFAPAICSTPVAADLSNQPVRHSGTWDERASSEATSKANGNVNLVCTPITITDNDSPPQENLNDGPKRNQTLPQCSNSEDVMLDLQQQNDFLLELANSSDEGVNAQDNSQRSRNKTTDAPRTAVRGTFTIHRDNASGNLILSPNKSRDAGVRIPMPPRTPVKNMNANTSKLIVTPEQKKLLLSKFGRSSAAMSSPQRFGSVQQTSRIPVIMKGAPAAHVSSQDCLDVKEANAAPDVSQSCETAEIIKELQKRAPSNAPVIVIPVNQTFNQAPASANQTTAKKPTYDNSPSSNEISSTTAITTPQPIELTKPVANEDAPSAVNNLRLQDILTEDESSNSDNDQPLELHRIPEVRETRQSSNSQNKSEHESKPNLRIPPPRTSSKQLRHLVKSHQLSELSVNEILDLRRRNSRGELRNKLYLSKRASSLFDKEVELELLRRSIQDKNYEDEVLQLEVLPSPPDEFSDNRQSLKSQLSATLRTIGDPHDLTDESETDRITLSQEQAKSSMPTNGRKSRLRRKKKMSALVENYLEASQMLPKTKYLSVSKRKLYSKGNSEDSSSDDRSPNKSYSRISTPGNGLPTTSKTNKQQPISPEPRNTPPPRPRSSSLRRSAAPLDPPADFANQPNKQKQFLPDEDKIFKKPVGRAPTKLKTQHNSKSTSRSRSPMLPRKSETQHSSQSTSRSRPSSPLRKSVRQQSSQSTCRSPSSPKKLRSQDKSQSTSRSRSLTKKSRVQQKLHARSPSPPKKSRNRDRPQPMSRSRSPPKNSRTPQGSPSTSSSRSPSPPTNERTEQTSPSTSKTSFASAPNKAKTQQKLQSSTRSRSPVGHKGKKNRQPPSPSNPPVDPVEIINKDENAPIRRSKRERKPLSAYWSCTAKEYRPLYDIAILKHKKDASIIKKSAKSNRKKANNLPSTDDNLVANTKTIKSNSVDKAQKKQTTKKQQEKRGRKPKLAKLTEQTSKSNSTISECPSYHGASISNENPSHQPSILTAISEDTSPGTSNASNEANSVKDIASSSEGLPSYLTSITEQQETCRVEDLNEPSTSKSTAKSSSHNSQTSVNSTQLSNAVEKSATSKAAKSSKNKQPSTDNSTDCPSSIQQVRLTAISEDSVPTLSCQSTINASEMEKINKSRSSSELMPPPLIPLKSLALKKKSKSSKKNKNAFRTEHDESIADVSSKHVNKLFDQMKSSSMCGSADDTAQSVYGSGQGSLGSRPKEHNAEQPKCKKVIVKLLRMGSKKANDPAKGKDKICDSGFSSEEMSSETQPRGDILLHWLKQIVRNGKSPSSSNKGVAKILQSDGFHTASVDDLMFQEIDGVDYAFYNTKQQFSFGYMRFNPQTQKKKCTAKKYELNFVVLCGTVKITANGNTVDCKNGDLITVFVGTSYGIQNISNDPALVMVIKK